MSRVRPRGLLAITAVLCVVGLTLKVGLDPLLAGDGASGHAATVGTGLLALAGLCLLAALMLVEPAWPISLGVAAMIFSSHWDLTSSPIPLDRVLIVAGVLSLILRARTIRDVLGNELSAIHVLLLAAALFAFGSAVISGTIGDHDAIFALLDRYGIVPFVLFAVAPAAFPDARTRRILLITLTVVGAYLAYTSILARVGPQSLVFPQYIVDPAIGIHADRARGPFVESVANGLALFECGVAAAFLWRTELDSRMRMGAALVVAACSLSIVLTLTRSIWIGSAVALLAAMASSAQTRRLVVPIVGAVAAMALLALAVVPGLSADASSRESDQAPIWDRENTNAAALRMVGERPLLGFGWFEFQSQNAAHQRLADDHIITGAGLEEHNVFLSNAAELGLLGTLLWGAALVVAVGGGIFRRGPPELDWWRVGLVAIAVQWLIVANFVPLGYAFPTALLWLWAGVAWYRPSPAPAAGPIEQQPTPASWAPTRLQGATR